MEHLALEIYDRTGTGSKFATLPDNTSISITDTSEVFDTGDVWSLPFTLNITANAHVFGTSGDMHGNRLHEQINKRKARLWVDGLPLYLGHLRLEDEVDVDTNGNVDVSLESGQKTFEEMIDGAKANQVPMMGDVQIGMALWRKRRAAYRLSLEPYMKKAGYAQDLKFEYEGELVNKEAAFSLNGENDNTPLQQYPQMVFPKGNFVKKMGDSDDDGTINFLNTDSPYSEDENGTPTNPYCNIALCYQKYGYERTSKDGTTYQDYNAEPEAQRGYEVMPANRVNSAPCFFVIYWIRALMKHLGIHVDENQMMGMQDLRRLFFVNTKCAHEVPKEFSRYIVSPYTARYGVYCFKDNKYYLPEKILARGVVNLDETNLQCTNISIDGNSPYYIDDNGRRQKVTPKTDAVAEKIKNRVAVKAKAALLRDSQTLKNIKEYSGYLFRAFATSDCFPDKDIRDVIQMLENAFGIRFLFDNKYQRVRIVLLRNLFRNSDTQDLECTITKITKEENSIRGFRMTYGAGTENTAFYYKGFADKLPSKKTLWVDNSDTHDYSHWQLNATYGDVMKNKVTAFNKTCYVTPNSGNAYGIKIDKDAKKYEDLHPSLFGFADFMDAEDGDCTGEPETIKEINVGFTPAIMNDLNMINEREGSSEQRFALFVDTEMRPRRPDLNDLDDASKSYNDSDAVYDTDKLSDGEKRGLFQITSEASASAQNFTCTVFDYESSDYESDLPLYNDARWDLAFDLQGQISEGYRLYLQDNFSPNDDGVSPIEKHDWGLSLGIMRGSGSDAHVDYTSDPDDSEGNDTWEIIPGSNETSHPDTCDDYGKLWDYNGSIHVENSEQAETEIRKRYPNTTESILSERYPVQVQQLRDAGWQVSGDMTRQAQYYYYHLVIPSPTEGNIDIYCTPIVWYATRIPIENPVLTKQELQSYIVGLWNQYKWDMTSHDTLRLIYAVNPSEWSTLAYLRAIYFGYVTQRDLDNGLGITDGRFSLKLRAEKPNPYFDTTQPESETNRRYLHINDENLQGRGLMDQFYKEYSYWVRNARIAKMTVRIELAQLLSIDKTKRVRVGDITGFIRKMEYQVSNQSGLGIVTMEIMYI